jgi:hypothetical protein
MTRPAHRLGLLLAATLLLSNGTAGAAQKVFRCGPDGRTYSQTPCNDGHAVDVADPRSTEQRKAAADALKREGKAVDGMTRERQAQEAAAAKLGPARIGGWPAAKPAASAASGTAASKRRAGTAKSPH